MVQFHADTELKAFADHCGVIDQSLKAINERQNKIRARADATQAKPPTTSPSTTLTAYNPPRSSSQRTPLTDDERQRLRNENKCFYCRANGHRAFECPAKTRTTLSTAVNKIEEEAIEDSQGKANP
jgi:hypothetical protein